MKELKNIFCFSKIYVERRLMVKICCFVGVFWSFLFETRCSLCWHIKSVIEAILFMGGNQLPTTPPRLAAFIVIRKCFQSEVLALFSASRETQLVEKNGEFIVGSESFLYPTTRVLSCHRFIGSFYHNLINKIRLYIIGK